MATATEHGVSDNHKTSSDQQEEQVAVPYTPPPNPTGLQQTNRPPIVNTMIIVSVILLGGFMMYNYVGQGLTRTAGQSIGPETYVSPTPSPTFPPQKNTPTPSSLR